MSKRPGLPAGRSRIVAEGLAIVLSILLAFSIDAWWEERGRAQEEQLLLTGLLQEIDQALLELDTGARFPERVVDAASRWRQVTVDTHPDTLGNLVHRLGAYRDHTIQLASADALLSTGLISGVGDPAVRRWISSWPGRLAVYDRQSVAVADFARNGVLEYFAARGLSFESIPRALLPGDQGIQPPRDAALLRRLVADGGLRTLFVQGARMSAILVTNSDRLREFLEEGRELVRTSLEE